MISENASSATSDQSIVTLPIPFRPYYEGSGITIYHADCRQVLPFVGRFDLLLTDPPYGIGAGKMNLGMWRTSRMEKGDWDKSTPPSWLMDAMMEAADKHIVWGGNYYGLPPSRQYLIWDKGAGFKGRDFAECEQAWCSWDGNAKVYLRDPLASGDYRDKVHPTQKPAALMKWCLGLVPDAKTVLDPFMGSGTTLVASKLEGRQAVGIEINEAYCESAAKRLSQGTLF
jgi:DNA modification methylase